MIQDFLKQYINVVQWDIDQLVRIAQEAETQWRQENPPNPSPPPSQGPPIAPTTVAPRMPLPTPLPNVVASPTTTVPTQPVNNFVVTPQVSLAPQMVTPTISSSNRALAFYNDHKPQFARCTVPLAMTLISVVEHLGALIHGSDIWDNGNKFEEAAKNFFRYADPSVSVSNQEIGLFRAIFRNGMMHGFFPQGIEIGIEYDSRLAQDLRLFFREQSLIVLNVNRLQNFVELFFNKVVTDTSIHQVIQQRLTDYYINVTKKTRIALNDYQQAHPV